MTSPSATPPDFKLQTQLVDAADCIDAADATDPALRADIELLFESLRDDNQKVPVLLARHPTVPGKYVKIDGHGRIHCLHKLGRKVWAIVLDRLVDEAERLELEFSHNLLRRSMSASELAAKAARYMELTGATQQEAARRLKCGDATLSRAFGPRRVPAECREAAGTLSPTVLAVITPLRTADAIKRAVEFASTPGEDGRRPTREQVTAFVTPLRKGKPAKKPKRLKLRVQGRRFEVELRPDDTPELLVEACKVLVSTLSPHRNLTLPALTAQLAEKPAALA